MPVAAVSNNGVAGQGKCATAPLFFQENSADIVDVERSIHQTGSERMSPDGFIAPCHVPIAPSTAPAQRGVVFGERKQRIMPLVGGRAACGAEEGCRQGGSVAMSRILGGPVSPKKMVGFARPQTTCNFRAERPNTHRPNSSHAKSFYETGFFSQIAGDNSFFDTTHWKSEELPRWAFPNVESRRSGFANGSIAQVACWLDERLDHLSEIDAADVESGLASTAEVFATFRALCELPRVPREIMSKIVQSLEGDSYTNMADPMGNKDCGVADGDVPPTRVPWWRLCRQQYWKLTEIKENLCYCENMTKRWEKLQRFRDHCTMKQAVGQLQQSIGQSSMTSTGQVSLDFAMLIFTWGFWKAVFVQTRRCSKQKAVVMQETDYRDIVKPFKHWQMAWLESLTRDQVKANETLLLESYIMANEVQDLEFQLEDSRGELHLSLATEVRFKDKLDILGFRREHIAQKLTSVQPELLKSSLDQILNMRFSGLVREARLDTIMIKHALASKDFGTLLSAEEEDVMGLKRLTSDAVLIRWINYHIGQFKHMATNILENVARSCHSDGVDNSMGERNHHEMPARDAELYADRCRIVRAMHKVNDLAGDLRDGMALAILYAGTMCKASAENSMGDISGGNCNGAAAALWLLDSRDSEHRANNLVNVLRPLLATSLAQCLLRPSDITNANQNVLSMILSALFLQLSGLPARVPGADVFDFFQAPSASVGEESEILSKHFFDIMSASAKQCAHESIQDLAVLLFKGEVPNDLERLAVSEFLIRWINYRLGRPADARVLSLREFKGGHLLMELFQRVAPDILSIVGKDERVKSSMLFQVLVDCGNRCTSFDVLTKDAIQEGQVDVLAAFLSGLFISRPGITVASWSKLGADIDVIKGALRDGVGHDDEGGFQGRCCWIESNYRRLHASIEAVRAAENLHNRIKTNLSNFQADLLTQRCQGAPCKNLGGEDARRALEMQRGGLAVEFSRIMETVSAEEPSLQYDEGLLVEASEHIEDSLRKNASFLREVYRHYAMAVVKQAENPVVRTRGHSFARRSTTTMVGFKSTKGQDDRVPSLNLRSFTRLYKDSGLRRLNLLPVDMESIYHQLWTDQDARCEESDRVDGLNTESFTLSLIVCAARGCRHVSGRETLKSLSDRFSFFIEKYIWPNCMPRNTDFLYATTYDVGLGPLLSKYAGVLKQVFQHYYESVVILAPDFRSPTTGGHAVLDVEACVQIMEHANLVGGNLDEATVRLVHRGVQLRRTRPGLADETPDESEDESDDSEGAKESNEEPRVTMTFTECEQNRGGFLAFQEFIDFLIAVSLYVDPNPFAPFVNRFEKFIRQSFFVSLRQYWTQAVDGGEGLARLLASGLSDARPVAKEAPKRSSRSQHLLGAAGK